MVIRLKTPGEIEAMRAAGRVAAEARVLAGSMLAPGVTTGEIDGAVEALLRRRGAATAFKGVAGPVPFPAATCISVNDEMVHGVPGPRRLREGDIVTVDVGCRCGGWYADTAWSWPVGAVDDEKRGLLTAGEAVLQAALRALGCRPTWSGAAREMQAEAARRGFRLRHEFTGHGIGRGLHEDPQVQSAPLPGRPLQDFRLEAGLVFTIEPVLHAGDGPLRVAADQWTLSACDGRPSVHFEHTVALTARGPLVLTSTNPRPAGL